MLDKEWIVHQVDHMKRTLLSQALSISPITATVLLARGVFTTEQAHCWLSPNSAQQHDPFLLPDMEFAVDRLHHAVKTGERICFYGDYDVDGISATSLYVSFFRDLGANAGAYIPHRIHEGYGLHESALHKFRKDSVSLLVTSDCGTTALKEVALCTSMGMDVIITDHHQPDEMLPDALAVINPHRADSHYPFTGLCSTSLAYRVIQAYVSRHGLCGVDPESYLDLVAMAAVADVMPLQDENRFLVRDGLRLISRGARLGVRALKLVAGVDRDCTTTSVAFKLAPRINAAGRLAHAETGVRLLTTESETEAKTLALELDALNRERQRIEEMTLKEAVAAVASELLSDVVVVWGRGWHLGVVGIVAARLVERYHRPAIVIAVNEQGIGKGSARGIPGFNLYTALSRCRDLLVAFGGHPSAAGLTITEANLPVLRERISAIAQDWTKDQPTRHILEVDAQVELGEMRPHIVQELDRLHPYGAGNPEPTLVARDVAILSVRVVGNGHLKLTVRHNNSVPFDGIGFRMGQLAESSLAKQRRMDLAFVPELNRWNGLDRVQLRIRALRASQS